MEEVNSSEIKYPTTGLPSIEVFFNPKNKEVLIACLTTQEKTGFTVSFGQLLRTDVDTMREDGIRTIRESLAKYNTDAGTEPSELDTQKSPFYRRHRYISVAYKADEDAFIIQSMDKVYGGHVGEPENRIKVPIPATSEELWTVLEECFQKCKP